MWHRKKSIDYQTAGKAVIATIPWCVYICCLEK